MITFARSVQIFLVGPENEARSELRSTLLPVVENVIEEMSVVTNVCQHFYRRAEIDLAPSDEDLDGVVAMGGDVVELIHAYAMESHSIWLLLQDQLSFSRLQEGDVTELVTFSQDSLLSLVTSLKDKIGSLFKSVCRGAFTDAVAPRSRENRDPLTSLGEGRPQWQIRAQAIHSELLNASTLRVSLNEANEVCQTLQGRIRELERSDSQYRVVTQKLESEVLRLTESVSQNVNEKTQLEAQLTKEREQFDAMLDESHKEKAALDSLNRELRKQLKRSSDAGAASASHSSRSKTSTLSHGDTEAFRQAFAQLHSELRQVRATLAIERLDRVLGPSARRREQQLKSESIVSDRLLQSLKDVSTFSNQ
uniref:Dynein associated protein domain-containing protein n=1 Tax=Globisporangium ultimum (strain ATCC 200006 / CBS 805.95 / DAOM BR144) TaxID=431595 RepID=K3WUU6_GLOUD